MRFSHSGFDAALVMRARMRLSRNRRQAGTHPAVTRQSPASQGSLAAAARDAHRHPPEGRGAHPEAARRCRRHEPTERRALGGKPAACPNQPGFRSSPTQSATGASKLPRDVRIAGVATDFMISDIVPPSPTRHIISWLDYQQSIGGLMGAVCSVVTRADRESLPGRKMIALRAQGVRQTASVGCSAATKRRKTLYASSLTRNAA